MLKRKKFQSNAGLWEQGKNQFCVFRFFNFFAQHLINLNINNKQSKMQRRKVPSQQVPCDKDNCCGASIDHNNYLSATSRGGTQSKKKKVIRKPKKRDSAKELLQEHWDQLREENKKLEKKLQIKKRKIEELKLRIQVCQTEIYSYQQKENDWKTWRQKHESSVDSDSKRKKLYTETKDKEIQTRYNKIIQDCQIVAKESLQRYKILEQEYNHYKEATERKISKLKRQNSQISSQKMEKQYNKQIQQLKQDLNKFKEEHLTCASVKNLHTQVNNEQKLKLEINSLKLSISELKKQKQRLQNENQDLAEEIEEHRSIAYHKETELKNNLDLINSKVTGWEKEYRELKQECREWEEQYNALWEKHQRKRQKYKRNNQEWAQIFKQFIHEIDKLKSELEAVSDRNLKLIKMCEVK